MCTGRQRVRVYDMHGRAPKWTLLLLPLAALMALILSTDTQFTVITALPEGTLRTTLPLLWKSGTVSG